MAWKIPGRDVPGPWQGKSGALILCPPAPAKCHVRARCHAHRHTHVAAVADAFLSPDTRPKTCESTAPAWSRQESAWGPSVHSVQCLVSWSVDYRSLWLLLSPAICAKGTQCHCDRKMRGAEGRGRNVTIILLYRILALHTSKT